jgi:hypothetical protein
MGTGLWMFQAIYAAICIPDVEENIVKKLLLVILLLCPLQTFAAQEDWYTYWSFGFSDNSYPGGWDPVLDAAESQPGIDRTQGAMDIFGFYWPVQDKLNLGFVISGSFDAFSLPGADVQVNQYLYGASVMKFFGKEIGDGLFLRGDLGIAKANLTVNTFFGEYTAETDTGVGYLLGVGYGIPVSEESRVLLSLNVSNKDIDGENWSAVTFNIGGLW